MKAFFQKYKHAWVLLYGFIYLPWFFWLESRANQPYHVIHVWLDDKIPFVEYFIVPYLLWFVYIAAVSEDASASSMRPLLRPAMPPAQLPAAVTLAALAQFLTRPSVRFQDTMPPTQSFPVTVLPCSVRQSSMVPAVYVLFL